VAVDVEKEKKTQLELEKQEQAKKTYSIDFMMGLRDSNKTRPTSMAMLDFPHKKRLARFNKDFDGNHDKTEFEKFNRIVGDIRILLNKLSKSNFDTIQSKLLSDFEYTPSLLYELTKIIFVKSTTETHYLEFYVKLCIQLFKRFNDADNPEMNFRKLLLTRCEKQFNKMLVQQQAERRERRASMEAAIMKEDALTDDFSNLTMQLYDESELRQIQKDQMQGNMFLIVELF
jgi:hypothetical protein